MTKIAFIGGGSVQWTPGLVNDMALTPALAGVELVLNDIDAGALERMLPAARYIVKQLGADIRITASLDRRETLCGADFVVLCVAIGGLPAFRNDLEIPQKYGIHQSVGDTVGPGGWSRALRHIPFAVQVGREMEELCPQAWLLNLTNPMTTICRSVTRATRIRTVGLCHEVAGVRQHLAGLFHMPAEEILLEVAGINHLPVVLGCRVGGRDGLEMLRQWLSEHDPLASVSREPMTSVWEVFNDQLAVKLTLFQQLGILFGAGDRHVAEFFPGFLIEGNERGLRYGVRLTTADYREEMLRAEKAALSGYLPSRQLSGEQLAPLMGALLGGTPGKFVVNVPNVGQVDNLPRQAVVECMAYADRSGVWPLAVGSLPEPAHAVVAAHVDRQELIVEAVIEGNMELARAALASDPLVRDPQVVEPLFEDLLAANRRLQAELDAAASAVDVRQAEIKIAGLNAQPAPEVLSVPEPSMVGFSASRSTLKQLLENAAARAILEKHFPGMLDHPQLHMAMGLTLEQVAPFAPNILTKERLAEVEVELSKLD